MFDSKTSLALVRKAINDSAYAYRATYLLGIANTTLYRVLNGSKLPISQTVCHLLATDTQGDTKAQRANRNYLKTLIAGKQLQGFDSYLCDLSPSFDNSLCVTLTAHLEYLSRDKRDKFIAILLRTLLESRKAMKGAKTRAEAVRKALLAVQRAFIQGAKRETGFNISELAEYLCVHPSTAKHLQAKNRMNIPFMAECLAVILDITQDCLLHEQLTYLVLRIIQDAAHCHLKKGDWSQEALKIVCNMQGNYFTVSGHKGEVLLGEATYRNNWINGLRPVRHVEVVF